MKLMFLLRLGIFFAFLTLIYLSQRFWFVGTWHWIGAIQRSNLRNGLQILWFVGLLTVLAGFLDPMLGAICRCHLRLCKRAFEVQSRARGRADGRSA